MEENGGGSLGSVLDVYYIPTSALSYTWTDAGWGDTGGASRVAFNIPSGGSWILIGTFSWTRLSRNYTCSVACKTYSGGTRVELGDTTDSAGAGSGSLVSSNLLCFRIA